MFVQKRSASSLIVGLVVLSMVAARASAQGANDRYYRFEEGLAGTAAAGAGSIVDSFWGSQDGTPSGGPIYSSDVPLAVIPQTGAPNSLSLSFNGSQSVLFRSFFLLHRGFGDATLEFFQKGPNNDNEDIFWTRPTTDPDANRFNIFNYVGKFWVDYREPGGALHVASPTPVAHNVWTHIAVVKDTVSAAPSHQYRIYLDGVLCTTTDFSSSFTEPDPNQKWTVSGRNGYTFTGLIDEIRLTQRALDPSEFLIAAGPGPFCTAKSGLACGTPYVNATGTPQASATSGFFLLAGPARSCKSGVLLYNTSATAGVPFHGGTLCVTASQIRRGGPTNSGGTPGGASCNGEFSIDMNAFAASTWVVPDCAGQPSGLPANNPAAYLRVAGQDVYCQFWGRDSVATGSFLSAGIRYTVAP